MSQIRLLVVSILIAGCAASCGPAASVDRAESDPPAATPSPGPRGTALLAGHVYFDGVVPPAEPVDMSSDPNCVRAHPDGYERQRVRVSDGGLADVLVHVHSGIEGHYQPPEVPLYLDQKACTYSPHVLALQLGQGLAIRNLDHTLHNIHPRPERNPEFNLGQPRHGMESTRVFDSPEYMIPVGCDVHRWMSAFVSVVPHPFFAVTDGGGAFEIQGLPAGHYQIRAVHETLGEQMVVVNLADGESARLDYTFRTGD